MVRRGLLTICEERDGIVVCTRTLGAGDSAWIPPWAVHATLNLSTAPAQFQVVGQPGSMSGYFAEAGVAVPDVLTAPARPPAGPAELRDIAARWEIEFWTGPVDNSPPPAADLPRVAARGATEA